jgi:Phage tail tube protein
MTQPTTLKGSKVLIVLGNGASPEMFAAPCGLTTKAINLSATANEFNVPDCDDPDLPMYTERVISALSAGVTGAGSLALEAYDDWRNWYFSAQPQNIRVVIDAPQAKGGGYYEMSAVLTAFNTIGNVGELATIDVTIASNGEFKWVAAGT